jgi:hypothetical protein
LHTHLLNPAKQLKKEAIQFFRQHPGDVMATDKWKKTRQENPAALCDIHQMVLCNEISWLIENLLKWNNNVFKSGMLDEQNQ